MNEYIELAINELIHASDPKEVIHVVTELNMIDEEICVEIALKDYNRKFLSEELINLINEPNTDLLFFFYNQNVYFLDNEVLAEMEKRKGKNYDFAIDYSVMLDTNYASYIKKFIKNPDSLDDTVRRNLDVLIRNNFRFDYMIYIIENFYNVLCNTLVDKETLQKNKINFYENLFYLELFKNINVGKYTTHGIIEFNIDEVQAKMLADELFNGVLNSQYSKNALKDYYNIHRMMILYIIGILKIRFYSNKAAHNKMNDMFTFMNEVAGIYFDREMKFTFDYLEKPQEFKMFDKIRRNMNRTEVMKVINNIAWDFSIPRIAERFIMNFSQTRYCIPLILTHDINMKTVFNSYKVKGIIFNKEKTFFVSYPQESVLDYLEQKKCKINYERIASKEAKEKRRKVLEYNKRNDFKIIERELDVLLNVLESTDK